MIKSRGIVVTTSEYTKDFLTECLNSIKNTPYPILIVSNGGYDPIEEINALGDHFECLQINPWNGFELGGIGRGKDYFGEFIHLMDSCIVKDISLFDKLFEMEGNVFLTEGGYHYMGKFVSESLPYIPTIDNKNDAIALELQWLKKPYSCFTPDLPVHTDVFEEKHGQRRMVLENEYIIKYKGTFHL